MAVICMLDISSEDILDLTDFENENNILIDINPIFIEKKYKNVKKILPTKIVNCRTDRTIMKQPQRYNK